jgi:dimethylamine/trimethylamine dehydrogenase
MEQPRIQRRLLEAGVDVRTSHALVGAGSGAARVACTYTERERELACDAIVLVTARLPEESLALALEGLGDGGPHVRAIGDARSPGTIAAAVWDGRRYAEELDDPAADDRDSTPFLREVIALHPEHVRA